jgi:hypothetical protein
METKVLDYKCASRLDKQMARLNMKIDTDIYIYIHVGR